MSDTIPTEDVSQSTRSKNGETVDSLVHVTLNMDPVVHSDLIKLSNLRDQEVGETLRDAIMTLLKLAMESKRGYTEITVKNPRSDSEKHYELTPRHSHKP